MRLELSNYPGLIVQDLARENPQLQHVVWADTSTGEYCLWDCTRDGSVRIGKDGNAVTLVRKGKLLLDWRNYCGTVPEV